MAYIFGNVIRKWLGYDKTLTFITKTTLIQSTYTGDNSLFLNMLIPEIEDRFARNPSDLIDIVKALPATKSHIILDEIQKVPKLLDVVHHLIETT